MHHPECFLRPWSVGLLLAVTLISTACVSDELDPELADLDEVVEPAERVAVDDRTAPGGELDGALAPQVTAAYSPWRYISGFNCGVYLRYCKTSTRINWQFTGNTYFDRVSTYGDAISYLTTNISGVSSGSKYRTRAGLGITWVWDDQNNGCGTHSVGEAISLIPSC